MIVDSDECAVDKKVCPTRSKFCSIGSELCSARNKFWSVGSKLCAIGSNLFTIDAKLCTTGGKLWRIDHKFWSIDHKVCEAHNDLRESLSQLLREPHNLRERQQSLSRSHNEVPLRRPCLPPERREPGEAHDKFRNQHVGGAATTTNLTRMQRYVHGLRDSFVRYEPKTDVVESAAWRTDLDTAMGQLEVGRAAAKAIGMESYFSTIAIKELGSVLRIGNMKRTISMSSTM